MTTHIISVDSFFDQETAPPADLFEFANLRGTTVTLTFDYSPDAPDPFYGVAGSAGVNAIVFNIKTNLAFDSMVFTTWSTRDKVTINCTAGDDTILYGTTQKDLIRGLGGNDRLTARSEGDTVQGGSGDDSLTLMAAGSVAEGGTGTDLAFLNLGALPLLVGLDIDLSDGGGGRDAGSGIRLSGIEQLWATLTTLSDSVVGGALQDQVDGGEGGDRIDGAGGNDILRGEGGDDTLLGGDGRDALFAGTGRDRLTGGAAADRFIFRDWTELGTGTQRDTITDFELGRDRIDLSAIDGLTGTPEKDPLHFIGETLAVPGQGAQVGWEQLGGETLVQVTDNSGNLLEIRLTGLFLLTQDSFIL